MQVARNQVVDLVIGQVTFLLTRINQFLNVFFVLVFDSQANPIPCLIFFGSVRAQKGQGAMRAAKGIFRTVDEPFGQVDARPSKSYRISWNGVCSSVAPRTTLRPNPDPPTSLDGKQPIWFLHRPWNDVHLWN